MAGESDLRIVLSAEDRTAGVIQGGSLSLTDLKSAVDLAMGGFELLKGAVEAVINPTVEYAEEVLKLKTLTGLGAEETSKLIQVADDLRITYDTLKLGMKNLIQEGIQPSIDNLIGLAEQYQALPDPVSKAQFAIDLFGARAGPEMQKLLEQSPETIKAMADEAERLGLVMSEDGVEAAQEYMAAMDAWNDTVDAATYKLGTGLLPALTDTVTWMLKLSDGTIWNQLVSDVTNTTDVFSDFTAEIEATTAANEKLAGVTSFSLLPVLPELADEARFVGRSMDDMASAADRAAIATKRAAEEADHEIERMRELRDRILGIPDRTVTVTVRVVGDPIPAGPGGGGGGGTPRYSAAGGDLMAGDTALVGEAGPELVRVRGGGASVTNHYNLSLMTGQSSGRVEMDFAMMRAVAKR